MMAGSQALCASSFEWSRGNDRRRQLHVLAIQTYLLHWLIHFTSEYNLNTRQIQDYFFLNSIELILECCLLKGSRY